MKTRSAWLSAVVAVAVLCPVAMPGGAWGQDKTPAASQQTEPHGKIVRDAPDALRVQDMTMDELQQRLAEYEAGKRDDRDGYIILNQLWFNYQAQQKTTAPEFQVVAKKRAELLQRRADLGNLQDFRLSDKIRHDKRRKDDDANRLARLRAWVPKDAEPKGFFAQGNRAAVKYQYRIEFFELPSHLSFFQDNDSSWKTKDSRTPSASPVPTEIPRNNPVKVLSFRNNIVVYPRNTLKNPAVRLLACTRHSSYYSPSTTEERAAVRAKGYKHGLPWKNEAGTREDFCGVVDLSGGIIFEFSQVPGKLLLPVEITDNGTRAAVLIGKEIKEQSFEDGREIRGVGQFSEMLIWEYPNTLKRVRLKEKNAPDHVWYQRFIKREL